MDPKILLLFLISIAFIFSLACAGTAPAALPESIHPITITDDLTSIDLCQAIPQADIETVMRVKLAEPPTRYTLRNAEGTSGCYYEGPTDSDRERHFGYVILTPLEVYESQTLNHEEAVSGLGDEAYFIKGSDEHQLWVKLDQQIAFVIGFGDVAKDEGAQALAGLLIAAIQ
jgi:hypothetical protein